MIGPGVYDDECTRVRESTQAQGVIVINGKHGQGFSAQFAGHDLSAGIPQVLRDVADQIEASKTE